jgi:hypothetical protein
MNRTISTSSLMRRPIGNSADRARIDRPITPKLFSEFRQFEILKSIPEVVSKKLMRFVTPDPRVDAGSNVFAVRSIETAFGVATNNAKSLTRSLEKTKGQAKYEFHTS